MADETKQKVYDVTVTATDALKSLASLKQQVEELTKARAEEAKQNGKNTEEYHKLTAQIKAVNQEAATYQKRITNSIKLQNREKESLEKLRTQLALDNAEYAKLGNTQEELVKKDKLGARIAATTAELKKQEEALGDHRRSVGDYGKAFRELGDELKYTTEQLVVMAANGDTTSEAYKDLIARASELKGAQEQVNREIKGVSKGTEDVQALTGAASLAAAGYGVWTAASAALGVENEKVDETLKKMMTVITALNSLTAINNTLSKQSATYRTAQNLLQKIGINQTLQETNALTAKNAMLTATSAKMKIATGWTWLWNTALAANPIVIIIAAIAILVAGIALLTSVFKSNTKEVKSATQAQAEYEAQIIAFDERLKQIEDSTWVRNQKSQIARRKELLDLKKSGATKEELARAEYELNKKVRDAEIQGIDDVNRILRVQQIELEKNIIEWTELRKLTSSAKDVTKFTEMIEEANKKLNENTRTLNQNNAARKNMLLDQEQEDYDANQRRLDATLERLEKQRQYELKFRQESLKAEANYLSTDFITRQKYESKLNQLQIDSEKERLATQLRYGKITRDEYAKGIALLEKQIQQFYNKQATELNTYYKNIRENILKQVGQTTDMQIAEVITSYREAMKQLAEIQPPKMIKGMTKEDYDKQMAEYEEFLYQRAELELRLARKLEEDIQLIRENALAERFKKFDDALNKEYAESLAKSTDNERKRLEIESEMLNKQIEERRKAGESTTELEARIRANGLAQAGLDYSKDLLQAENSSKAKYEARKKYLNAELNAAEGNEDKILEIQNQMAQATEDYWNEMIEKVAKYASAVSDIMSGITDLLNTNSEAQTQQVEAQYSKEEEALADKYAQGLMSEAQYNREQVKLEKNKEKELAKIERDKARRERTVKIFNVVTDTAMGVAKAVAASPATFGLPWSAYMSATGALSLASILSEPLPQAARGRFIRGKSHTGGGEIIEAEGGEAIINKRSSSMFLPLLSAINEMGGGVPFTTVGSDGGYSLRSAANSAPAMSRTDMESAIQDAFSQVKIIATIEDIRKADTDYVNIEGRGTV